MNALTSPDDWHSKHRKNRETLLMARVSHLLNWDGYRMSFKKERL